MILGNRFPLDDDQRDAGRSAELAVEVVEEALWIDDGVRRMHARTSRRAVDDL